MPGLLLEQFQRVARDRPDEVVLWTPQEQRRWRPADLLGLAELMRDGLRRAGVRRGQAVLSTLGNHSAFIGLTLACLADGFPLLAADRLTPPADVHALASLWRPAAVVSGAPPEGLGDLAAHGAAPSVLAPGSWLLPLADPSPAGRFGDAVLLKVTSGSTGTPKVTLTAERHLLADVRQIVEAMDIGPTTRQVGVIPLSHSYGFSNLVLPLLWQGSPLLLHAGFSPVAVAEDADGFRAETWAGVPFMFDHAARQLSTPCPPSIRTVVSAGAPLAFDTVAAFHARTGRKVHSFYGSSETGGICYDDSTELDPLVPVGRPLGAALVTLADDPDAPADSGRVLVGGAAVVDGYADGADADAFVNGAFVTSDFGRLRQDGGLVLTGRASAVVNVAGRKVWPSEVEAAMRTLPDIHDVVVMGVDDERRGQSLGACVVASRPMTSVEVRTALARSLAPHKVPRIVVQVLALPLTARGKLDRLSIAARLAEARDSS